MARLFFVLAYVIFGTMLAVAQDKQPPSRDEFDALRREVEGLKQKTQTDRPAVPWKIGAQWRIMANSANFGWHPATITNNEDTRSFINQRFRTWLSFSPTTNVGGYLQMEVGHVGWGEDYEGTKTYGTDSVGIELRRAYLIYKSDKVGTFRAGIQDWHDAFGESPTLGSFNAVDDYDSFGAVLANSIWDFNVGGITWSQTFPNAGGLSMNVGLFQLWEGDAAKADDVYLFGIHADSPVWGKEGGIGASLYYLKDRGNYSYPTAAPYQSSWDVWFGVRAARQLGGVLLRGWVILNRGERDNIVDPDFEHTGWAAKLELSDVQVGPGKISVQALYSSGEGDPTTNNSSEFRTIAQSERDNFGAQGYWSYLVLTSPHGPSDVKDLGVGLQNRGLGLITVQAKYACPLSRTFSVEAAAGGLWSEKDNPTSGKRYMGTEIASTFTWDLGGGLKLAFGSAYLLSGDFYKAPATGNPQNLWEIFSRFQLEF